MLRRQPFRMGEDMTTEAARRSLRTRAGLELDGVRDSALRRMLATGQLVRIQRNQYIAAAERDGLWAEAQHRIAVVAAAEEMREGLGVASHDSAAVLHRAPLYRHDPRRVHFTVPGTTRISSGAKMMRHTDELPDEDITVVDGIACTTLERTVFDVARTLGWEASVACADAALRSVSVRDRVYDLDAADSWKERMRERVARARGRRGVRQAARVIEFADGRAELPGESVSRVQLARLGFTDVRLQVPVASPRGRDYEVDIAILEAKTFWEFDGQGKYLDEAKRSGRSVEQVVLDEKRREDWIRGKTQWRFVRGEDVHISTPRAMAKRLESFGIRPLS